MSKRPTQLSGGAPSKKSRGDAKSSGSSNALSSSSSERWYLTMNQTQSGSSDFPKFPFVDTYFNFSVCLIDGDSGNIKGGVDMKLRFRLLYENDKKEVKAMGDGALLELHEDTPPRLEPNGQAQLRMKICVLSMDCENRKFCIEVSPEAEEGKLLPRRAIRNFTTTPITVVRYRLQAYGQMPRQWWKDEGGKTKMIDVPVRLFDATNRLAKNHEIPLKLTLLYEDGRMVDKQEILTVSPDTRLAIGADGTAKVRVRFGEVSKNHQNQAFKIRVSADTDKQPLHFDVSPTLTTCCQVLSKVNKKSKQKKLQRRQHAAAAAAAAAANVGTAGLLDGNSYPATAAGMGLRGCQTAHVPESVLSPTERDDYENVTFRNPPKDPSMLQKNALFHAASAAYWCDTVKDLLCRLRSNAAERQSIENQLFDQIQQFDPQLRNFMRTSVDTAKTVQEAVKKKQQNLSNAAAAKAAPELGDDEEFKMTLSGVAKVPLVSQHSLSIPLGNDGAQPTAALPGSARRGGAKGVALSPSVVGGFHIATGFSNSHVAGAPGPLRDFGRGLSRLDSLGSLASRAVWDFLWRSFVRECAESDQRL